MIPIPRRLLLELVGAAALIGVLWWWHHATYEKGIARQRAEDQVEIDRLTRAAEKETARLQGVADAAEKARHDEHDALTAYRLAQPLHGSLCQPSPDHGRRYLPDASTAHRGNEAASAPAADLQPVPARDPEPSGSRDADVRHLLDVLAGRADEVSATLREFQAR